MISGYTIAPTTARACAARQRADDLAEHVANGGCFQSFADKHSIGVAAVSKVWRKIVAELGAQAA